MLSHIKNLPSVIKTHRYGFTLFAYLSAAVVTGFVCVFFMRMFEYVLEHRLDFESIGFWCFLTTPVLFLAAVVLIERIAPYADGAGIPQVVFLSRHINSANLKKLMPLAGANTFVLKILALLIGLVAGASTGREGPTVHVAACVFLLVMVCCQKWFRIEFDWRSVVIAGGAAGLAAAFNTPMAGVTFAIEELSTDYFGGIKDYVVMAIIFASLSAQFLTGYYSYFGILQSPQSISILSIISIGFAGGMLGSFFSTVLIKGNAFIRSKTSRTFKYTRTILLSLVVLLIALVAGKDILGPGNNVAQDLLTGQGRTDIFYFPFAKLAATLATYWSGIAGGIFAPCLSIGASLGAAIGSLCSWPVATCALVGMAAFLSGTIQAPLTSFVIIFEMTGHHEMLVPVMLASFTSFIVARLLKADHLYSVLAENYRSLIEPSSHV